MKGFLVGIILTLVVLALAVVLYVRSSRMSVAATDAPLPFETTLAKMGLHARVQSEAPKRDVSGFSTAQLLIGANVYQNDCSFCHSQPQQSDSVAGTGMYPHAPQLFKSDDMVTDDPAGVTYWKVKNGIRLTGMPSFKSALSEDQLWDVTALLARADKLPPEVLDVLKVAAPVPASTSETPAGATGKLGKTH